MFIELNDWCKNTSSLPGVFLFDLDSSQKVVISPLPLTLITPLSLVVYEAGRSSLVVLKV